MNPSSNLHVLSLAVASLLLPLAAYAQDSPYYYGGVSLGQSRTKLDVDRLSEGRLGQGLAVTDISRSETDLAYKLFAGYQFNRWFAIEGGYFNLGKFRYAVSTQPSGSLNGQLKAQGLNLDLVGTMPIGERFAVIGRVGAQYARTSDSFGGTGAVPAAGSNPSRSETNYKVGAGLQYAFSSNVVMRAEAERYRISDAVGHHANVDMLTMSLVFPFGRTAAAAPRAMAQETYRAPVAAPTPLPATPAPVAAAPVAIEMPAARAPVPMPAPVVAMPAPRRVSFSAESLFGFDHSEVRPEGRKALDVFTGELKGTQYDTITVQGHADRLGTPAYNQTLSAARAESVKAYLVGTGGVSPTQITASGMGETSPVTKPDDCKGAKPTTQLIACLQPDRRVDVEVSGTR